MKECSDQHAFYYRLMNAYWVVKNSLKFSKRDQQVLNQAQAYLYYAMKYIQKSI
jgi:hypothetical protein